MVCLFCEACSGGQHRDSTPQVVSSCDFAGRALVQHCRISIQSEWLHVIWLWDEDILLVLYSCIFHVSDRRLITNQSNLWIWSTLPGTSWPYLHFNKCRRHIHPRKTPPFCKLVKHDKFNTHTHNGPPEDNACDSQFSKAFTQQTLVLKGSVTSSDKWLARWLLVVSMGVSLRLRHLGTGKGRHFSPQLSFRIPHYGQKALVCSMRLVARQLAWGPPQVFWTW